MEKRINDKIGNYVVTFKQELLKLLGQHECMNSEIDNFIQSYSVLHLGKEDFVRRKRVKNVVPYYERCCAKRANGERCTRRKKDEAQFCGTHIKAQPHGVFDMMEDETTSQTTMKKIVVKAQDIKGIIYYIDDYTNVYEPHDILNGVNNPKIIAKYVKNEDNTYSIPEFGI